MIHDEIVDIKEVDDEAMEREDSALDTGGSSSTECMQGFT